MYRNLYSESFQLIHSLEIHRIILNLTNSRYQTLRNRLQYFDIWLKVREHLEPSAESTAFAYVTKLVYRIFGMLPDENQRQIVADNRKNAASMTNYLSFGHLTQFAEVEADALESFLGDQAKSLKQWITWLNDPNMWTHKYIDYTWVSNDIWNLCFIHCPR